ncbi:MAG TPA: hypothetical protein VEK32_17815 [Thermodesulfobacteriota bacterium]|nr:hypothetical protein [Thermodesulfobacteriota bacterium]
MKTIVVLTISIVLVSVLSCHPIVMTFPSMPADLQMVQPDPSLPKELSAFWGKWNLASGMYKVFVIVEKIGEEKASLYVWRDEEGWGGWRRVEANVIKRHGKYKLWYKAPFGEVVNTLKGEYLVSSSTRGSSKFRRVP